MGVKGRLTTECSTNPMAEHTAANQQNIPPIRLSLTGECIGIKKHGVYSSVRLEGSVEFSP